MDEKLWIVVGDLEGMKKIGFLLGGYNR